MSNHKTSEVCVSCSTTDFLVSFHSVILFFSFFLFFHQSKDKTVFFFAVEDKYEPIGFIHVPGPVQALQWSPPSHVSNTFGFFLPYSVRMSF